MDGFKKIEGEVSNVGANFEDCVGRVCHKLLNNGVQQEQFVRREKLFSLDSYDMV